MKNTTGAWVLGVIFIIILLAGAYHIGTQKAQAPTETTEQGMKEGTAGKKMAVPVWTIEERGEDTATGGMLSNVSITFAGETHDLGTHLGGCFEIEGSSWTFVEGEQSGVICWFAGGGTEFGFFNENGIFVVKQGMLDEGSAEASGMRGAFKTVVTF